MLFVLWKFVDGSMIYSNAQTTSNASTGKTVPILVHGRECSLLQKRPAA